MTDKPTDEKELDSLLDSEDEGGDEEAPITSSSDEETPDESPDSDGEEVSTEEDRVEESKTVALKREREMRKEYQRRVKELEAEAEKSKLKDTPKGKANSIRQDFLEMRAKTNLMELQLDDPTFKDRASEVKKVLFEDMPELLEKKDGIRIADDIAKGRLITSSDNKERKDMPHNQTTPAQPKRKDGEKTVSQKDYNNMSDDERKSYEASEIRKLANKK